MSARHASVLLQEVLHYFEDCSIRYFVDGTLGAGGHSEAILKAHPEIELLIGVDQDPVARAIAEERLAPWGSKVRIVTGNFVDLAKHLSALGIQYVDGILLDIGVSSMQFDMPEKGFSFMRDGPLDMRMDPTKELTAAYIVNHWSEHDLGRIFRDYGEEKRWRAAMYAIANARKVAPITTTFELAAALKEALKPHPYKREIHPLTLVFQALRIAVNAELESLESIIPVAIEKLNTGGRLSVISFHSLEDRIVKNAIRFAASDKMDTSGLGGGLFLDKEPIVNILTKKPITPTTEEIEVNPRSRSAKLRVIEKR
ncbi:MAG: 16S rRNA (cytosine(1402)-N(4))-methyltransferase RsmH [Parachlamydiaceae bacterium]|nr:16S rRNA (cytosine(1402)-N(4))-methyltransferase RsmH [Parachlamydiaceae bacterium]